MRTTGVCKAVRRCRRRRQTRQHRVAPPAPGARRERVTGQGSRIETAVRRAFLKRALEDDAVADPVNELLFEHVVAGRYHRSVVAESLPTYIAEILAAATGEDWQAVADELIAEAREVIGEV
jgi:hypothetical protein